MLRGTAAVVAASAALFFIARYGAVAIAACIIGACALVGVVALRYAARTASAEDPAVPLRHKYMHRALIVAAVAVFIIGGVWRIGQQTLVDEPLWLYKRIPKFWNNVAMHDWRGARVSDKPGVTVALLAGAGFHSGDNAVRYAEYKNYDYARNGTDGYNIERFFAAQRLPILLAVAALLPLFFFVLRSLVGAPTALLATIGIATQPVLLGMSRIINPDALLWAVAPLALVAFLAAVQPHTSRRKVVILGIIFGALFGLALLTKYVANILFIAVPLMAALVIVTGTSAGDRCIVARRAAGLFFGGTAIALAVVTMLYPYVWSAPQKQLLKLTLHSQAFGADHILALPYLAALGLTVVGGIVICVMVRRRGDIAHRITRIGAAIARVVPSHIGIRIIAGAILLDFALVAYSVFHGMSPWDMNAILGSPKSSYRDVGQIGLIVAAGYPLLFGLTLPIIGGVLLALGVALIRPAHLSQRARMAVLAVGAFSILYALGSALNNVATPLRYQIMLFPLWALLGAIGWMQLRIVRRHVHAAALALLLCGTLSLALAAPHYFSYANMLLPQRYVLNLKDMGDGSYEAAQYLNALPNARNLVVWTDKRGLCRIFVGKCTSTMDFKRYITEGWRFDYYVVTTGRQRKITRTVMRKKAYRPQYLLRFDKLYAPDVPYVWQLQIARRTGNWVRIIDARTIDITYDARYDD